MRLRITFALYPGDGLMPNAIAVTDNYMEDDFGGLPDWYVAAASDVSDPDDAAQTRECFVEIPDEFVEALFASPTVTGVPVQP